MSGMAGKFPGIPAEVGCGSPGERRPEGFRVKVRVKVRVLQ